MTEPPVIAVMSFNRPHLLRKVLQSLAPQVAAGRPVALFQDGAVDAISGVSLTPSGRITRCEALFRTFFPVGEVFSSPFNIGVARNYWRAEHWAFEAQAARACYFIEDDHYLSPHFVTTMDALAELAYGEPRIGLFTAYGNSALCIPVQRWRRKSFTLAHHRWAFGMTSDIWQRTKALYADYLDIVGPRNYRERPVERIRAWMAGLGVDTGISSMDMAHTVVMLNAGAVSLSTVPAFAQNFGKQGLHAMPGHFRRQRVKPKRLSLYPEPLTDFEPPTARKLDAMHEAQLRYRYW